MASNEVNCKLLKDGVDLLSDEGYVFNKYDSLATSEDISSLFDVLCTVTDSTGRHPVLTPVSVVANPQFDKIKEAHFENYYFEPFTETLKKYPGCEDSFILWKEGIEKRLFVPQFHGREHLNVKVWMKALRSDHVKARTAFNYGMWGISTVNDPEIKIEFQAAFDFVDPEDIKYHEEVIETGLKLFTNIFGYQATYFVPPNGPFSSKLQSFCAGQGIKYLSVAKIMAEPAGDGEKRIGINWLGRRTSSGITCMTRNCFFEPCQNGQDWVDTCLNDISTAFKWRKPALISSHRVNYIGALDTSNRDRGLKKLRLLINSILKHWPDAEFLTTAELGDMMTND